jgi:hypothetical protein
VFPTCCTATEPGVEGDDKRSVFRVEVDQDQGCSTTTSSRHLVAGIQAISATLDQLVVARKQTMNIERARFWSIVLPVGKRQMFTSSHVAHHPGVRLSSFTLGNIIEHDQFVTHKKV